MKAKNILIILIFILTSCKRETKISTHQGVKISERVQYQSQKEIISMKSGQFTYKFDKNKLPFRRIIILNASLLGYITELNAEDNIVAVAGPEYIYSQKINNMLISGKIQNIGSDQKYDVEKIIALKPDAIFTNYVPNFQNTYQLLKTNGIEVIFLDEYLEQFPLDKTAYIKVFGALLGKEKLAETKYTEIKENYNQIKATAMAAKAKPFVLANEMYGDVWYLPGGKTPTAQFVKDAGARYILENNTEAKANTMSFEEVYAKAHNMQYWVNAGNHKTLDEMLKINPFYSKISVFKKGKVFGVSGKEKDQANDFFESGSVRSDLVLKDYVKIFHPEIFPNYQLTYMNELR